MIRRILLAVLVMACSTSAFARGQYFNYVHMGGQALSVAGFTSSSKADKSYPGARVSVYKTGTTNLATLYADSAGTSKSNPFTSSTTDASFTFFTDETAVDITFDQVGITTSCGGTNVAYPCIAAFTWTGIGIVPTTSTIVSVKDYGVKGDTRVRSDGVAVGGNFSFTSSTGAFTSADTGKAILISGAGVAGADLYTTVTFVSSTAVTLVVAPSTSVNPATFYIGTDDTTNLQTAITAVGSGAAFTPVKGIVTGTTPELTFPSGVYLISSELSFSGTQYAHITSGGNAILVQAVSTNRIFVLTGGYTQLITGLKFIGGKYAIDYRNANVDVSQLVIRDCEFQVQSSYSIWTQATNSSATTHTNVPYSTGTLSTTAGSNNVTGSGTTWVDANHAFYDLHTVVTDQWYKVAEVTGAGAITLNRAATSNLSNVAYEIADYHLSLNLIIERCRFYNVNKVLFNSADHAWVHDCWVELIGQTSLSAKNFSSDSAAFRNFSGILTLDGMFGVPVMGTAGVDLVASPRWVDIDSGALYAVNCRFGGELSMAIVWYFTPYNDVTPFQQGGRVVIRDSVTYAGQSAASASDPGVLVLRPNGRAATKRENVPAQFVFKGNQGLTGVPLINNAALLDTGTFFAAFTDSTLEKKFRYDISTNDTGTDSIGLQGTWNALQSSLGFLRFTGFYTVSGSVTFTNPLAANTCNTQTLTVTGVRDADTIYLGIPNALASAGSVTYTAYVNANDTVTIRACNPTTVNQTTAAGASTVKVSVRKANWFTD